MTFQQLGDGDEIAMHLNAPHMLYSVRVLGVERTKNVRCRLSGRCLPFDEFVE